MQTQREIIFIDQVILECYMRFLHATKVKIIKSNNKKKKNNLHINSWKSSFILFIVIIKLQAFYKTHQETFWRIRGEEFQRKKLGWECSGSFL